MSCKDPRSGSRPVNELLERSITWSFDALASDTGMDPLILLPEAINFSRIGNELPILDGMAPVILLLLKSRVLSDEML